MQNELTTSQAVRTYSMHPVTVLRLILTGKLEARKDPNGRWLIRHESLEQWNRQRGRRALTGKETSAATAQGTESSK